MKVPLLFLLAVFTLVSVTAAADLPEWARGWIVASVTIPVDGDLKDASVDFQMPDDEPVTLIAGAQTKGGVALSNIAWEGTPVVARVRLRQGGEFADLFAAAALVAKSKVQKKAPGQIEIESRFIELPEALALTLKDPAGNLLFGAAAKGGKPAPVGHTVGVLKAGEEQALLAKLMKLKGADLLSAPKVTTKSAQRAVIEIIRECKYPTEWREDDEQKGLWHPTAFEVRNAGVTLEIEPTLREDGTIDLQLTPQVVEHLGWADVETGKPVKSVPADPNLRADAARTAILRPVLTDRRLRPVFSARKVTTNLSIFSGNSVVISGVGETEDTKPFKPKTPGRRLIVIITARQMTPE